MQLNSQCCLLAFLSDSRVSSTIFIGHHIVVGCGTISLPFASEWNGEGGRDDAANAEHLRYYSICARGELSNHEIVPLYITGAGGRGVTRGLTLNREINGIIVCRPTNDLCNVASFSKLCAMTATIP